MSQAFTLASQIMQSLNELKRANFVGVLPRNQALVDRFYIAIDRAAERIGEHILRGVEETLSLDDTPSDAPTDSSNLRNEGRSLSRREQELLQVSKAYEANNLQDVSIQERACLLAMYNHLRAVSRADMLVKQTRQNYWQKDFEHAAKDKRHLAGTTTHYLNIYASMFNYPDDNKEISDNAEVKDTQHFDPETGHTGN